MLVLAPGVGFGYGVPVIINPEKSIGGNLSSKGEFGWAGAFSTWFAVDPSHGTAVILMANLFPSTNYMCVRHQLWTLFKWYTDEKSGEFSTLTKRDE
jgi:CubicO group peptidase (beta-lactamase class C family)